MLDELTPDPEDLFGEWIRQVSLADRYGNLKADTQKELDEAKNEYKVEKAKLGLDARKNPVTYNLPKATDKIIEDFLDSDEELNKLNKNIINKKYAYNVADVGVTAVETKRQALKEMRELAFKKYFAEPTERALPETDNMDMHKLDEVTRELAKKTIEAQESESITRRRAKKEN